MKRGRTLLALLLAVSAALLAARIVPSPASRAIAAEKSGADSKEAQSPPFPDEAFWKAWGDGQAELCGYDLTFSRYGGARQGTAVTIFVTEPFSNELRVKADPGKHSDSDEFQVIKLNLMQDFPTGVYDYNLMTSTFVALEPVNGLPSGSPTKVSFSAQEWCGHVYQQALFDKKGVRLASHSYWDGEADEARVLGEKKEAVAEEALLLWARGFAAPFLEPGEWKTVPMLPSMQTARLLHRPMEWTQATLSRSDKTRPVTVPAGVLECETWKAEIQGPGGGHFWTIDVEAAPPRRIVRWETTLGVKAELLAGERMKYWEMNAAKFLEDVKRFGLEVRPPRTM